MFHTVKFDLSNPVVVTKYKYTEEQEKVLHDLETTKAKQFRGQLYHRNKGFCCLGRFCNTLHLLGKVKKTSLPKAIDVEYDQARTIVPYSVRDLLKLHNSRGKFINTKGRIVEFTIIKNGNTQFGVRDLIGLNDDAKMTFKEIARFIRQYPHYVFGYQRQR